MAVAECIRVQAVATYISGPWVNEIACWGFSLVRAELGTTPPVVNRSLPQFEGEAEATQDDLALFTVDRAWRSNSVSDSDLDAAVNAFHTFNLSRKGYWSDALNLNQYRVSAIQPDGKVINGATIYNTKAQTLGSQTTMALGPTGAQVLSIRTGGRGPRNRGRMYVPYHREMSGAGGTITASHVLSLATDGETLFRALSSLGSVAPAVVSRKFHTYSGITAVGSGDEIDQQQRRRGKRREVYTLKQV